MDRSALKAQLCAYVDANSERLITIVSDLIQIPSENTPPYGAEAACQRYLASALQTLNLSADVYSLASVVGLTKHPAYFEGRDYNNRPNLAAIKKGSGGGRSLILSGHIDTVPAGTLPWTREPFSAQVEGNRLYGRGASDMKGGIAANLFVFEALADLNVSLAGDLTFESVVDEEFGGSNGTLAGRLKGFTADAAIISEPSSLRICAGQRGGRTAHITLSALDSDNAEDVVAQLQFFLNKLAIFATDRRTSVVVHPLYRHLTDPVPVMVTKITTGPWGNSEPIGVPERCRIELYWQTMPGETQEDIEADFYRWLDMVIAEPSSPFEKRPQVHFPIRWLPGSAISPQEPLVSSLSQSVTEVTGEIPPVVGIEGPCDLYIFQQHFSIPAVLWGAKGGSLHGSDEYLELDSLLASTKALLLVICEWCGISNV